MKFNEIVFVNFFHNGDLHLSREFVRKIKNHFPGRKYSYAHKKNPYVLHDLGIGVYPIQNVPIQKGGFGSCRRDNTLFLNTWYGSYDSKFNNSVGIAFDALYNLFNYNCDNFFNIKLSKIDNNPANFFPTIDYQKYKIEKAKKYLDNASQYRRKIFISNGACLSGQAANFSMAPMINKLAQKYTKNLIIYTNKDKDIEKLSNVIYSGNIIKNSAACDLNENSYISSRCDVIVGRSSGTYTFAMTQDNMFKNKKLMVSFSNLGNQDGNYWLGPKFRKKIKYTSRVVNYNVKNAMQAFNKLDNEIKCHFK